MPPAIRRAAPADAAVLSALADRLFVQTFVEELAIPYPKADLAAFLAYANSEEAMGRRLADPAVAVWIAEHEDRAVAYAVGGPADLPHPGLERQDGMLHRLYLEPEWRGRALAGPMLDEALAWLEAHYSPRPWLTVYRDNVRAQRFYARRGFDLRGECDYPVGTWIDREFVMQRGRPRRPDGARLPRAPGLFTDESRARRPSRRRLGGRAADVAFPWNS
jgi:GNAT superfamily N-acetyltransferase